MVQLTSVNGHECSLLLNITTAVACSLVPEDLQQVLEKFKQVFKDPEQLPSFRKGFNHKIPLL